jgi:hypothetical protein
MITETVYTFERFILHRTTYFVNAKHQKPITIHFITNSQDKKVPDDYLSSIEAAKLLIGHEPIKTTDLIRGDIGNENNYS